MSIKVRCLPAEHVVDKQRAVVNIRSEQWLPPKPLPDNDELDR